MFGRCCNEHLYLLWMWSSDCWSRPNMSPPQISVLSSLPLSLHFLRCSLTNLSVSLLCSPFSPLSSLWLSPVSSLHLYLFTLLTISSLSSLTLSWPSLVTVPSLSPLSTEHRYKALPANRPVSWPWSGRATLPAAPAAPAPGSLTKPAPSAPGLPAHGAQSGHSTLPA